MKIYICTIALLSACVAPDATVSGFDKPSATGRPNGVISEYFWGDDTSATTGNRYAYEVGETWSGKFGAFAGTNGSVSVTAPPLTGQATMTGRYELAGARNVDAGFLVSSANAFTDSGVISVNVDFANRTLAGSDGTLTLNGSFTGSSLTGNASYLGVSGPMKGLVGADEAIGVFHGNSDVSTHAGGFIVNPDP